MALARALRADARALGFDLFGVARAAPADPEGRLPRWLAAGNHASMSWMTERIAERRDPRALVPGARSVIMVAVAYRHPAPAPPALAHGRVSCYAWGRDYHNLVGKRLRKLRRKLCERRPAARVYCAADTGPVMEKAWAQRAGLGWIGRNGNLITRRFGSWIFLGALITDLELPPDDPALDRCGTCRRCLAACPTAAILPERTVDARRCLSFWTIESRAPVPERIRDAFAGRVFGCDDCQDICPWNRRARTSKEQDLAPRAGHAAPLLEHLLALGEADLRERFAGSPLRRATRDGLVRNACVAAANGGHLELAGALRALLDDHSAVVREHAAAALARLQAKAG